ncbi:MAG: esterase/lipase family protein [Novosphingobium sp.]
MHGRPPPLRLWAAEALEIPKLLASPFQAPISLPPGQGQPVIVYPGYLTSDISSIRLRRSLKKAGYAVYGWEFGQNKGARPDLLERLSRRVSQVSQRHGQAATLIGWSLGGVYAREVAKVTPEHVRLVITLGSPFSGSPRANNAWRLYELLNDHPVDNPPLEIDLPVKPAVRTVAVWSPIDGIVSAASACGLPHESDRQVEVPVRHLSLTREPRGIRIIGALLAEELAG